MNTNSKIGLLFAQLFISILLLSDSKTKKDKEPEPQPKKIEL